MIPPLEDGVLPEGIHDCTMDEVGLVFGRFQRSDRRIKLLTKLEEYVRDAKTSKLVDALIIDGSFVTAKEEPEDVDIIVLLLDDWDGSAELKPFEYNVISRRAVKVAKFPFDLIATTEGLARYLEYVDLFGTVHVDKHRSMTSKTRKGMLRVQL